MSFDVKAFVTSPNIEVLEKLKKDELLAVTKELQITDVKATRKSELKKIIVEYFVDAELLDEDILEQYSGRKSDVLEMKTSEAFALKRLEMERQEREKERELKRMELADREKERELQKELKQMEIEKERRKRKRERRKRKTENLNWRN